ncbi:MAG TPA: serine/threonine-protein kinase, partial [Polyangiaceae bacterium]
MSGRVQHPNVVATYDVIAKGGEAFLVMEYVHGESLSALLRAARKREQRLAPAVAVHILCDVLSGLHAAHEATDEFSEPLRLVHRDVSPQNIMVGVDGVARVLDFGIAKAAGRLQETQTGQLKGKIGYMAPEQLLGRPLDRRVDIFAAGIVLWEAISGRKMFDADNSGQLMYQVLEFEIPPLSTLVDVPLALS